MTLTELSEKIGRPITEGRGVSSSMPNDYLVRCAHCSTRIMVSFVLIKACLAGAPIFNIPTYCMECESILCEHDWEVTGSYTRRGKVIPTELTCRKCQSMKDA